MTEAQKDKLAIPVEDGPDLNVDDVVRWRMVDLRDKIRSVFGVEIRERSVGKYLMLLSYRRFSVRLQHPKSDPEAQEVFKKNFHALMTEILARDAPGWLMHI